MRRLAILLFLILGVHCVPDPGSGDTCFAEHALSISPAWCKPTLTWPSTIPGMPLAQAPSATPSFPPTISPPYDGDPLSATQLRVDDLTPLQNGIEAARILLYGGGIKRRVSCTSNTNMVVQPLSGVLANLAGTWTALPNTLSATVINPAALSGGLAANTRYWVYAKIVAGPTLTFIVNTTAPDAGLNYQSGDESALWISTFVTNAASNILPYRQSERRFVYSLKTALGGGSVSNLVLDQGSTPGLTAVSTGVLVPADASSKRVAWLISANPTAIGTAAIRATGYGADLVEVGTVATAIDWSGDFEVDGAAALNYFTALSGGGTISVSIWVTGFDL